MGDFSNIQREPDNLDIANELTPTQMSASYEKVVSGQVEFYRCTFLDCSKIFKYKSEISRHIIVHSTQKPHYCTYEGCNKSFKRMDAFEAHLRTHEGNKPFVCEFPGCNCRFVNKGNLYYHLLKHENKKIYKCKLPGCTKTFLTKAHLKQHEKAAAYHARIVNNKGIFSQAMKKIKKSPPKVQNNNSTEELFQPYGNLERANEPAQLNQIPFFEQPIKEASESILEKLQKENKLLRKALKIQSELLKHVEEIHKPPSEQENILNQFIQTNTLYDDQDFKFIEFFKGKEDKDNS